jgi:hypothetical protein
LLNIALPSPSNTIGWSPNTNILTMESNGVAILVSFL